MPAPTTIDEFLDLVRKSGVVEEKRLSAHLDTLRGSGQVPSEPVKLATQFVRDGVLTHFQAEQFLQGKWRRFTIGKYKVLERLGAGGMGSVYLCEHMLMRRRVAVKVLPAAKAEDSSSLERFYREARAVAALDHPNIVRAYDIDQDENLHFLVMEHVDGSSLQEIIKRTGGMDVLRAAHYIRQAALGLQHAHEAAALVHRDIKPGNILVDRNGIVKILDMGLARFFHDEEDVLTRKYDENVLGTADYLAPEQALDSHAVDIRADLYSLGATFYFCLTGRTPFEGGTVAQKLIWHQTRAPKPIRSFRPEVPEGIVAVIDKMMAKDANQRYQSPQELADALEPWTQTPIPPPPDNEMPQFSLAATRALCDGGGANSLTSRPPSDHNSPSPRKLWQVSGSSSQATATAPMTAANTKPITPPPRESRPAPAPAPMARTAPAAPPVAPSAPVSPAPVAAQAVARAEARAPAPVKPSSDSGAAANGAPAARPARAKVKEVEEAPDEAPERDESSESDEEEFAAMDRRRSRGGSSKRKSAPAKKSPLLWILLGLGLLVALPSIGLAIYFLAVPSNKEKITQEKPRQPIFVGPSNPLGLEGALKKAKPGDRIILQVDINEANLHVTAANVTIEPEAGRTLVWKCPPAIKPTEKYTKLLNIHAPGVTVRDITFDGDNKTEALIQVIGKCPGVKLENLKLRNSPIDLLFANVEGDKDNPVVLQGLEFTTTATTTAARFLIVDSYKTITTNRFITFRDCKFNGPTKKFTTPKMTDVDLKGITLPADVRITAP
jgi:serine/threonine protein kinase